MTVELLQSPENEHIARCLREAAEILHAQGANPFRVGAYRRAADTIERMGPVRELYAKSGRAGLDALPGIGPGLAGAIAEMLDRGHWSQLDRLKGMLDPATLFRSVPGIGPELAQRIHDALDVETLEGLELACHDGRLRAVPGVGARRAAAIRAALGDILGRSRWRGTPVSVADEPPIAALLDVDREYRESAAAGRLPTIAPRRFNSEGKAWLPVLHTVRGPWHFTALFSNTAQAHARQRTHDWVVLYFHSDAQSERQRTVVTETRGALAGQRVVRGREAECAAFYRSTEAALG